MKVSGSGDAAAVMLFHQQRGLPQQVTISERKRVCFITFIEGLFKKKKSNKMNKLTEEPSSSAQAFFKLALVLEQKRRQVLDGVRRSARHKEDFL